MALAILFELRAPERAEPDREESEMSSPERTREGDADQTNAPDHEQTPGAAGHPEPGSGHDDSETTTVDEGPPIEPTDGISGAHGDVEIDRQDVT
jgi:hypothetical protein